ncbi:MAG: hypothetical protein A3J27_09300 [Candidatus Tectomicrobia bacterium RIFCSPLOWO2_12_FULL_69_37]|nr:MAG: hypothetical protein A3J27_09300 [Candidatus Tectomicrobia bacterium RIFCSPLOWO2_12_FULL_69_37]OGL59149.1 MAG: hypothetical protein A3I72_09345 [Candidatus Tectomicrobia bacterium RIFCSPLOWO2_02_FULL_70_19]
MPKDEFEFEDPMELVSIPMPGDAAEAEREMARCLAEEFLRMGHTEEEVLGMFRDPFYAVLHNLCRSRGEAEIRQAITQAYAGWPPAVR